MTSLKSLCLISIAYLECSSEALDVENEDKKFCRRPVVDVTANDLSYGVDVDWFRAYEQAHQLVDPGWSELPGSYSAYRSSK